MIHHHSHTSGSDPGPIGSVSKDNCPEIKSKRFYHLNRKWNNLIKRLPWSPDIPSGVMKRSMRLWEIKSLLPTKYRNRIPKLVQRYVYYLTRSSWSQLYKIIKSDIERSTTPVVKRGLLIPNNPIEWDVSELPNWVFDPELTVLSDAEIRSLTKFGNKYRRTLVNGTIDDAARAIAYREGMGDSYCVTYRDPVYCDSIEDGGYQVVYTGKTTGVYQKGKREWNISDSARYFPLGNTIFLYSYDIHGQIKYDPSVLMEVNNKHSRFHEKSVRRACYKQAKLANLTGSRPKPRPKKPKGLYSVLPTWKGP